MKVFISWSGDRSKGLANALRDWLPLALQYVQPFVSDKDISAGERWAQQIAGELEASNFGIICITPENLNSEWILFESGALSKSMQDGKVIPLLYGLELSELSGPLSQFQAQKVEQDGIAEIVRAINDVADNKVATDIIDRGIPSLWPQLNTSLENIPNTAPDQRHSRPQREVLEDLVTSVRGLDSRIRDIDLDVNEKSTPRFRKNRFHPRMIDELLFASRDNEDEAVSLLLLAGLVREDLPWISEILSESYREIRDGTPEEVGRTLKRLRHSVSNLCRSKMAHRYADNSKQTYMLLEELPMFIDMITERLIDRFLPKNIPESSDRESEN